MHVDHNMHVIGCNMHVTCTLFRIGKFELTQSWLIKNVKAIYQKSSVITMLTMYITPYIEYFVHTCSLKYFALPPSLPPRAVSQVPRSQMVWTTWHLLTR